MENLEDAVALFSPKGEVDLQQCGDARDALHRVAETHPARQLVSRTLATRHSAGPISIATRCRTSIDRLLCRADLNALHAATEPDPTASVC